MQTFARNKTACPLVMRGACPAASVEMGHGAWAHLSGEAVALESGLSAAPGADNAIPGGFNAGLGFRTHSIEHSFVRLGRGLAGHATMEQEVVHVPDLSAIKIPAAFGSLIAAEGFTTYYGVPLIAKGQIVGVWEIFHRSALTVDEDWDTFLEAFASQAAIAIDNGSLFNRLQTSNTELQLAYDATIEGWSRALDLRDKETEGHTQRVTEMTLRRARVIGLPESALVHVRRGSLLHDMGKMGIPDEILLKPGPLTEEE